MDNTDWLYTPPCTECKKYVICKNRFEAIALKHKKTTKNIEEMMASGVGVCDEFEKIEFELEEK